MVNDPSVVDANVESNLEQRVEQGSTTRSSQAGISAPVVTASPGPTPAPLRIPDGRGGQSMAEMAQGDLDAALHLLADRAQYITGAHGAAIALRRDGKNDMLCRASTGSNVPELGALLSTESGLSGESVRTRQPLRCDDAERDPRVNREGCRHLGIASVAVMPVVNDDEVLGVFELFSGKVNAFGDRDFSALRRLSQMVETAVKLARAAENLPEVLKSTEGPVAEAAAGAGPKEEARPSELQTGEIVYGEIVGEITLTDPAPAEVEAPAETKESAPIVPEAASAPETPPVDPVEEKLPPATMPVVQSTPAAQAPPSAKKPLFWSAVLSPTAETDNPADADHSHVPPVLRNLRTCEACGFPVSPGRTLCVECEEKKWRGQLRGRRAVSEQPAKPVSTSSVSKPAARAVTTASTSAAAAPAPIRQNALPASTVPAKDPTNAQLPAPVKESRETPIPAPSAATVKLELEPKAPTTPSPEFVLSAGLEPSQSWLANYKYILGAILLAAATVGVIALLR